MSPTLQPATWKTFILSCIYGPLLLIQIIWALMHYNDGDCLYLLIVGWLLFVLFFVVGALPRYEFKKKGHILEGESYIHTTTVVDTGIYAVVRHPQFLSWIFLSSSLACISQHWLHSILVLCITVFVYLEAVQADSALLEKFGDDYRDYMKTVPRMNIVWGILKYGKKNS